MSLAYGVEQVERTAKMEDERPAGFADDDVYLLTKIDDITELIRESIDIVTQAFDAFVADSTDWIQNNYERRRAIVNTTIAYFLGKIAEEAQLNHVVLLRDDKCVIDHTKLLVPTEEIMNIPPVFPAALTTDPQLQKPEGMIQGIVAFINECNAP